MNINLLDYISNYIGDTSWAGETNHDNNSVINMDKAKEVLGFLSEAYDMIISDLNEHKIYRKGNASAEALHTKAGNILKDYRCYQNYETMTTEEFEEYWDE